MARKIRNLKMTLIRSILRLIKNQIRKSKKRRKKEIVMKTRQIRTKMTMISIQVTRSLSTQ